MLAIIDYGAGNLFSLESSLQSLGVEAVVTDDAECIRAAEKIILPGVGAFGDAAAKLRAKGLDRLLKEQAALNKPILGICLGMQLLFEKSTEFGCHAGLGLIDGVIDKLSDGVAGSAGLTIPHMGWNSLYIKGASPLFKYMKDGDYVYYVHSYYAKPTRHTSALSEYGAIKITGAVEKGSVFGVQFHPEKSGPAGLGLLQAFSEL